MLVDDYVKEEKARLEKIKKLKDEGSERQANTEMESLQRWMRGILGFSIKDTMTPGQLLKLFRAANRGEI